MGREKRAEGEGSGREVEGPSSVRTEGLGVRRGEAIPPNSRLMGGWYWPTTEAICLCRLLPCGPPPSAIRDDGMEAQGAGAGSLQRPLGQAAASGSTLAELSL